MEWSINFSVNNREIDSQHKYLISIINDVVEMLKQENYDFNSLYDIIIKMDNYITEHFQYEEQLMVKYDYPAIEAHVKQHNQFRYDLSKFNIFEVKQPKEFIEDALDYLMNWLSVHIMNVDKKLGLYLSSR